MRTITALGLVSLVASLVVAPAALGAAPSPVLRSTPAIAALGAARSAGNTPAPPDTNPGVITTTVGKDESFATAVTLGNRSTLAVGSSFVRRAPGRGIKYTGIALARFDNLGLIDDKRVSKIGRRAGAGDAVIDSEGRIVVAGWVLGDQSEPSSFGYPDDFAVARYRPSGRLDRSFGGGDGYVTTDFGADDYATSVALEPNGDIVVAGTSDGRYPNSAFAVARYLPNGAPDRSFASGGSRLIDFGRQNREYDLAVDDQGRIELAGVHTPNPDSSRERDYIALARLMPDGSRDRRFGNQGRIRRAVMPAHQRRSVRSYDNSVTTVSFQRDGGAVASAYVEIYTRKRLKVRTRVDVLGADGHFDRSFGHRGARMLGWTVPFPYASATQRDGRIVLAGSAAINRGRHSQFGLMRLRPDGRIDRTFGHDGEVRTDVGGGDQAILGLAMPASGKIVAAGYGKGHRGDRFAIARYRRNGKPDSRFG